MEVRRRSRRRNSKGNHLWNGCGSEAGKDERKPTESQVSRTGTEGIDKKPKGKGKARKRSESGKEGKHQWNSCGSETGKDERKQTGSRVQEPWKEGVRDQAGEKGESEEARAEARTEEATVRRRREEKERKKQRLCSEMLKRKRLIRKRKSGTGPGEET